MRQPAIQWIGAHPANWERGHGGVAWEAVVLHIAEGSMVGIDAWFNDARARASTHFAVGKDGAIHQYVSLDDTAYAHGAVELGATARLLTDNPGINPNQFALGIEHEGISGDALTAAQFDSSTRLTAWLFATVLFTGGATGVAVDRQHILRHSEISPRTRARCPGYPEATLARYVARVRELVAQSVAAPVGASAGRGLNITPGEPAAGGAPSGVVALPNTHAATTAPRTLASPSSNAERTLSPVTLAPVTPAPDPHAAYLRQLQDALTVQALALDDLAARATIQAANLRAALRDG